MINPDVVCLFVKKYPAYRFVNFDKLTHAGNLETVKDIDETKNHTFLKGDICDLRLISNLFDKYDFSVEILVGI